MRALSVICLLSLSLVGCSADTSHKNSSITQKNGAALSCFSIESKAADNDGTAGSAALWIEGTSCEAMCAAQGAACTAIGGYVAPSVCTDVPPENAVCRCCAVAK